jgi:uncharacterized protein (DUF433 family)
MPTALDQHIVSTPDVRGGRPRISGRRVTVDDIVIMHLRLGESIEQIAGECDLSFADIHAALAYYYDHRELIDRQIADDDAYVEAFQRDNPSPLREKLRKARGDASDTVSPG